MVTSQRKEVLDVKAEHSSIGCGSILSETAYEYESEGIVKGHKKLNEVELKVIL
jgi:hypothetical protein